MNLLNLITRGFRCPALLAVFGLAMLSNLAHAATIKMECKVAGYSTAGWIEIRTGSNTGGRVQYDPARYCYYTDRVARGEPLRITYSPSAGGEFAYWGYIAPDSIPSAFTGGFENKWLPFSEVITCPTDPRWREVRAFATTNILPQQFSKTIPIGTR